MKRLATLATAVVLATGAQTAAANVGWISSGGYLLHMSGNTAVITQWNGQSAIQGFGGYGQIKMNNLCLTGRKGNAPLTWEGCANDPAQRWKLANSRLNNEGGWCADVEGGRYGVGTRVMAWNCSGGPNQQWRAHPVVSIQQAAAGIANTAVRDTFVRTASSAPTGAVISTVTGKMVAAGGGNLVAAGGGNMVAAGGGNMVAAGGGN